MQRRLVMAVCLALAVAGVSTQAYLKLGVIAAGRLVSLRWDRPVEYFITNADEPGVSAPQLQSAIGRAFSAWSAIPNTSLSHRFVGFTAALPVTGDGMSVIGFRARPELDRVLASASFDIDDLTGRILESDIYFNAIHPWSVAAAGEPGRFDIESIGVHEVGHLLGLGHSAIGETTLLADGRRRVTGKGAVMFPIAFPSGNVEDRTLDADDRAGFSDLYGTADAVRSTGAIAGRVTRDGRGVFGAHVVAIHTSTGDMVSGFTLDANGAFSISRLVPGTYVVRVEPIDDADLGSFIDADAGVDLNFLPTFHTRLVAVPRGGQGPSITIGVRPK